MSTGAGLFYEELDLDAMLQEVGCCEMCLRDWSSGECRTCWKGPKRNMWYVNAEKSDGTISFSFKTCYKRDKERERERVRSQEKHCDSATRSWINRSNVKERGLREEIRNNSTELSNTASSAVIRVEETTAARSNEEWWNSPEKQEFEQVL